jgi:hypothetical protein
MRTALLRSLGPSPLAVSPPPPGIVLSHAALRMHVTDDIALVRVVLVCTCLTHIRHTATQRLMLFVPQLETERQPTLSAASHVSLGVPLAIANGALAALKALDDTDAHALAAAAVTPLKPASNGTSVR